MPRAKLRSKVLSRPEPTAILASAANLTGTNGPKLPITGQTNTSASVIGGDTSWHADLWTYYDTIGEFRYAVTWVGNLLSKATLHITQNGEPSEDKASNELLAQLYDGPDGQSDMLRQLGIHFTVAGDAYLMGINAGDEEKDDWLIGAANQTSRSDEGIWKVANETFTGVGKPLVIRLWQPHPQNRLNSDSPAHGALAVLAELDGLTKKVAADIDSRLAGAGMLLIPNEISFGSPNQTNDKDDSDEPEDPSPVSQPDQLVRALIEVSTISLGDQSTAAAKVPLVLQGPGENLGQIKHLTFWTELDKEAQALRTEAIRRLALSMDMPPEILTGTSDMNHWSSWQLEEAAIKAHTEPLLDAICAQLTVGYLRPLLDGKDAATFAIEADTSALRLRPNRSEEAIELYDRGLLAPEAVLRENGFDPADLADPKAVATWLTMKAAQGSTTPQLVEAALKVMGVDLGPIPQDPTTITEQVQPGQVTQEARPTPSLKGHPSQDIPDPSQSESQAVTASAEESDAVLTAAAGVMVYRALERVGNKVKSNMKGRVSGIAAPDLYRHVELDFSQVPVGFLLEDAWTTVDALPPRFDVDRDALIAALNSYTEDLLVHRKPLDHQTLRTHLQLAGVQRA